MRKSAGEPDRGPAQSRVRGTLLRTAGGAVLVLGALVVTAGFARWKSAGGPAGGSRTWWEVYLLDPGMMVTGSAVVLAGRELARRGRRHFATILNSPGEVGPGPFVLYLRSFADDRHRAALEGPITHGSAHTVSDIILSGDSEEEQLVAALRPLGPVVAAGRPGERLPEAGADRLRLTDADWQPAIVDLMSRARLVVLAVGPGPALMWELVVALRTVPPERLVLVIPMEPKAYEGFRALVAVELRREAKRESALPERRRTERRPPPSLPDYPPGPAGSLWKSSLKGVVHFQADGTPHFARLDGPEAGVPRPRNQVRAAVRRVLRPVFDRLDDDGTGSEGVRGA
ncbi:hypothetical protein [Streptomyces sp. MST-110588]|uniref:hypothetical protein n=1 Tax=Streptomyces sp. MST-110588 TaxID=2833628 RepID=UPI001F5DD622|nr:hypothetical protein [Streptomyces sp. MST-110588]UNO43482.1 hypothetical protein KGS77_33390 [Streptomyces sp. MST-110588]